MEKGTKSSAIRYPSKEGYGTSGDRKIPYNKETGIYTCAGCGNPVFKSNTKYDSGSGWPSFTEPFSKDAVKVQPDTSHGMIREEIVCANCGGHLGHRFPDGPRDKGGERYCINSLSMDFNKDDGTASGSV